MSKLAWIVLLFAAQAAPTTQPMGTVTGQIRSTTGSSVAGIRVTAMTVPQPGVAAASDNAAMLERLTTTDSDGRYRLENVTPGSYYITAGLLDQPSYYPGVRTPAEARVVAVTAGSSLSGIDITLVQSTGVHVTGQIKGLAGSLPDGIVRVMLGPTTAVQRGGLPIEALVSPNGTFEFQRVLPGRYGVRTNPLNLSNIQIEVKDTDTTIELTAGPLIVGQVTVENGSRLPVSLNPATAGITNATPPPSNANIPSLVQLIAVRNTNPSSTTPFGPMVRADGALLISNFPPGEYRIAARLPFGYFIKSMLLGDTDLLRAPLKIPDAASATGNLRVVLTTTPPANKDPGVKVSGRVTGGPLPPNSWITLQSGSGISTESGIGETMLRPDGTFEFNRVPPGAYGARVLPPQGLAPQIAIIVADIDVTNVEVPTGGLPPAASAAGIPAATVPSSFTGMPSVMAVQPPSYPPGVHVSGRVVMAPGIPPIDPSRTIVFFGPRDGLSVQAPVLADGSFELQHVEAGNYDVRTLPLSIPPISTKVVVGDKDVTGVTVTSR